jgi:hypothetical protein
MCESRKAVNLVNPVNHSAVPYRRTRTTRPSPISTDYQKVHVVHEVHEMGCSLQRLHLCRQAVGHCRDLATVDALFR